MLTNQELTEALRTHGYKVTPQRIAVYETLASTRSHPSAEVLYGMLKPKFPSMSLATVYKSIDILHRIAVVNILHTGEDSLRYDADLSPHNHVQCQICGDIRDVHDLNSKLLVEDAAEKSGYEIAGHQFYFYGICPECKKKH